MNLDELRNLWRRRVQDIRPAGSNAPYFWSDADFSGFLNEAQREAARRSHLLVDSTHAMTQVSVLVGDRVVALDPRIQGIRRARMASSGVPLPLRSVRDMDEYLPGWEESAAGIPRFYVLDYQSGAVCLWPPSANADTLKLTVVRDPLNELVEDDNVPEINSRYHIALLDWVSYRAFSVPDADTFDPKRAEKALADFEREFGTATGAINEHWALEQYADIGDFQ